MTRPAPTERLILASRSAARRMILTQAGVPFTAQDAGVDEDAVKASMAGDTPARLAEELAAAKALAVSRHDPKAWVIGSDQTLDLNGAVGSKPATLTEAREQLLTLKGQTHHLRSAVALARDGQLAWSRVDSAALTVRDFSDEFLDAYLRREGDAVLSCVGAYRLEGLGAQLFERVEGDYFTVLGLPLWSLLVELRRVGIIAA